MNLYVSFEAVFSHRLTLIFGYLSCFIFSSCSLLLDPSVCTTDADCNGGVCQVGVCIGTIQDNDTDVPSAGDTAGEEPDQGAGMMVDMLPLDMDVGGDEVAGEEVIELDMELEESFSCDLISTSLIRAGATLRNIPPEIDGSTHWLTQVEQIDVEVSFTTPNNNLWFSYFHFYLGEDELELTEEEGVWRASLSLPDEGKYRVQVVIGDTDDIRCVDQLFLTVDRSEPDLTLVSPNTPETWIGLLTGNPQTNITIESRDLTRVELSILDSTNAEISRRGFSDELLWSTDIGLREGPNLFTISAKDELQQESTQDLILHYDPYTPGIGLTQPASNRITVENSDILVSGFIYQRTGLGGVGGEGGLEVDARVIVTTYEGTDRNGVELNRSLTRSNSLGEFSLTTPIGIGANFVEICAYDRAENSHCTELFVTRVEAQPCVNITSSYFSATRTYMLTGNVCPSVEQVSLSIDGQNPYVITVQTDHTFAEEITIPTAGIAIPLGLVAQAEDGETAEVTLNVLWDNTSPTVVISSPSTNDCFNVDTVEVCGRVVDAESGTFSVNLNQSPLDLSDQFIEGEQWWEGFCTEVSLNLPQGLDFNEQTITLSGSNGAGIYGEASVTLIVDQQAPHVLFDAPVADNWYKPSSLGRVELNGTIEYSGCSLSSSNPIQMRLTNDQEGTLTLEGNGRFTYRTELLDGAYELVSTVRDRAGNEAIVPYPFQIDGQGPTLTLVTPESRSISNLANLEVILNGEDEASGLLETSAVISGDFGERPLTVTSLGGQPTRYQLRADLALDSGEHPLIVSASDRVGNISTLNLFYVRDTTPPTVSLVSPQLSQSFSLTDRILLDVSDDLSTVTQVTVNGSLAVRSGDLWLASAVTIDPFDPKLELEAFDEANNVFSTSSDPNEFSVTLAALSWQDPGRFGFPHRGYPLSNNRRSPDSGIGLGTLSPVLWSADFSPQSELLSMYHPHPTITPSPLSIISDNGVGSILINHDQSVRIAQPILPESTVLIEIHRASIQGVLTLFTLSTEDGASPSVRLWQKSATVLESTDLITETTVSPETWVEVRLGLPPILNANTIAIGEVNGDGRLDLITTSPTGVFLFRQNADGQFVFDGNNGLSIRGLETLSTAAEHLWWIDLNGDELLDLVEQTDNATHAWLTTLNAGSYQFTTVPNFPEIGPNRKIDGWLNLDWNQDGIVDPIAWSSGNGIENSLLRIYELNDTAWSHLPVSNETTLPQTLIDVLWTDLDADRNLELLCVGDTSFIAIESVNDTLSVNLPDLPTVEGEELEISGVNIADLDRDGDEDLLFSLVETAANTAEDANSPRGALWLLNSSPSLVESELNPIRILVKRHNAESHDALGTMIRVASNNDLNFDEIYPVRSFSETIINTHGEGHVNIQVVFPDHSVQSDHIVTEFNVAHGSQLTIVDPQE